MQIDILDAVSDATSWHRILRRFPTVLQDVYFWPEYVSLHRFEPGSRAIMFVYQQSNKIWAYPFLFQPISHIGEHVLEQVYFDIQTAYGYGGPVSNSQDADFLTDAHDAFTTWCQREGVVAEFIRLHPILQTELWLDSQVKLVYDRQTVSLNLAKLDHNYMPFSKKARSTLRRAERLGLRVVTYPVADKLDQFIELYYRAMARLNADRYYYFNKDYFFGLSQLVQQDAVRFLIAENIKGAVSVGVFLKGATLLHYHLSASDVENYVPGAVNQILYTAAQIGRQNGLKQLHLGGGRTSMPTDSLLKFKQSMATDSYSYYIGRRVHNHEVYDHLRQLWQQFYPSLKSKYGNRLLCYRYTS